MRNCRVTRRMRFPSYCLASVLAAVVAGGLAAQEAAQEEGADVTQEAEVDVPQGVEAGFLPGVRLISPLPQGEWHLPGGDHAMTRYSPLEQITVENAGRLQPVFTFSTGIIQKHEGQPLVVNDTMYIVTPFPNHLIALDLTQPGAPMKWTYTPQVDPQSAGVACCDLVNRGASYADGKIFYNTLDA